MAKRGRKSKAVKELTGNPGNRPIKAEAKGVKGKPDCPEWLDDLAKQEFDRTATLLDDMGVLSQTDRTVLTMYSVAFSRYVRAQQQVAEHGEVHITQNGHPQKSAWLTVADKAFDQLQKLQVELGLTPACRHKANVVPKLEASKWQGLISGLGANETA